MQRKFELFTPNTISHKETVISSPKKFYPQEKDWTCSVACIRTLLSGIMQNVLSEKEMIEKYNISPSPHYSEDIKRLGILSEYDTVFGCDISDVTFDTVLNLMQNGYFIMLECMYNYSHWMVLTGYYPIDDNPEKSRLLFYDPYYNKMRLLIADEFINMWTDGDYENSKVESDFVAVK